MKLRRTTILAGIEHDRSEKILPLIADDFARNEVHLAASLIGVERAERDGLVALMVQEHERLRALFGDAAETVNDEALGERIRSAALPGKQDLRISALEEVTRELRELLVDLHRHIETREDDAARELDRAIWRAIRDTENARNPGN